MEIEHIENAIEFPPFNVPVTFYFAEQPRAVAIVLPAMGTTASFYQPFAEALARHGISVMSPELPGTGTSLPRPSWKVDYGYRDLIGPYLSALVSSAKQHVGDVPVILIGHSLGAHVGTLAIASGTVDVDALVTVAGGSVYYKNWEGAAAAKVWFAGALFTSLTRLFGYMPGQYVGFGGPQARTLIREWSKIISSGKFSSVADVATYSGRVPMLALGIEGDTFAPEKSVSALADILNGDTGLVLKTWKGSPHSSWARYPGEVVKLILEKLDSNPMIELKG